MRLLDDAIALFGVEHAETVENRTDALVFDVRERSDHVALIEKDAPHHLAVLHDELAAPARLPEQRDHVAERARRRDLAGDAHDRAVLGVAPPVLARVAHEHDVSGRRKHAECPRSSAHALARHGADRMCLTPGVDADELVARLFHGSLGL